MMTVCSGWSLAKHLNESLKHYVATQDDDMYYYDYFLHSLESSDGRTEMNHSSLSIHRSGTG